MIVLLVLAWAVVLVPALSRPKFESSPLAGIRSFEQAMGILASTRSDRQHVPGRWVMVPKGMGQNPVKSRRQRLVRKRRMNFQRLLIAAGVTFVLGLIPALQWLLLIHVAVDAVLAIYVVQLRRWAINEAQARRVVRDLPSEQAVRGPSAGQTRVPLGAVAEALAADERDAEDPVPRRAVR